MSSSCGQEAFYSISHQDPKSVEANMSALRYAPYYGLQQSTAPSPPLGSANVGFDYVMAMHWSHLRPPPGHDSYPVTPESFVTASPPPNIIVPLSLFPINTEQHPETWEWAAQATSSPLLPPPTIREPSPSPLLLTVPLTTPETRQPSRKAHVVPPDFLHNCFPLDSEAHAQKRKALADVMTADWKKENRMEPHESLLLDFMRLDSQRNRWTCIFYAGGSPCGSSYKKKDQAKGHIRFHLQHFPYACLDAGPCPIKGKQCRKRYCAAEPRQKHRSVKTKCSHCGKPMLRGNVKRHRETACTQQVTNGSSPEYSSSSSPPHE